MTGQFKTFQTIYLDEICYFFYMYMYIYMVLFIQETQYGFNYAGNNANQIEKTSGLFLHSLSQIPIYTRELDTN